MSTHENKAIIWRLVEIWNTGQSEELEQLIDPDYVVRFHGQVHRPGAAPDWYSAGGYHGQSQVYANLDG